MYAYTLYSNIELDKKVNSQYVNENNPDPDPLHRNWQS